MTVKQLGYLIHGLSLIYPLEFWYPNSLICESDIVTKLMESVLEKLFARHLLTTSKNKVDFMQNNCNWNQNYCNSRERLKSTPNIIRSSEDL
jgi:hypothetical protein